MIKNIILTGFMGTGKSTIGRLLAQQLQRPFIDMDVELEQRLGKPIAAVFAQEGEGAFRAAESDLCQELAQKVGLVISTGGGALVNPANRQLLGASGVLICLNASVDEILNRVAQNSDRPLLPGDREERRQRSERLLVARRDAYGAMPHQIETTGKTPAQIIREIEAILAAEAEAPGMTRIPVHIPPDPYDICVGEGLLAHAGPLLRNRRLRPGPVAVISNHQVAEQHAEPLMQSLRQGGYEPTLCLVPEGEQHKTLATIATIYDHLLAAGLDRNGAVIALGGGVIGDMTGFAAATYLRGVPFVQIPTSLLAMVDASVGGKTGVDLPQGKNLIGAFKQPAVVIMDTQVLQSLPPAELSAGMAEVIKHGIIGAPALFAELESYGPGNWKHLVVDAVRVKVAVVEEDPLEQGRRAVLNLGHTFGHALEQVSQYRIRHGEGVAIGTVAATYMAAQLGRCDPVLVNRVRNTLQKAGLPVQFAGYPIDEVIAAMGHDKKRAGKTLRFIIPQAIGDVVIISDPGIEYVRDALGFVLQQ